MGIPKRDGVVRSAQVRAGRSRRSRCTTGIFQTAGSPEPARKGRGVERMKPLLGEGMLGSEGEFHLRQRRLAHPTFHRARLVGYADVMARYASDTAQQWTDGATIDVHAEMMRLTLAIAARTLFDADIETEVRDVAEVIDLSLRLFRFATLPFGQHLERVPLPVARRMKRARAGSARRIDAIVSARVGHRPACALDRRD